MSAKVNKNHHFRMKNMEKLDAVTEFAMNDEIFTNFAAKYGMRRAGSVPRLLSRSPVSRNNN